MVFRMERTRPSKAYPQRDLKRSRATRSEYLRTPAGGLPKGGAGQVSAVARKVRLVVQIEHLAKQSYSAELANQE